ncbi:amidase domain-containing protein [Tissierella sp.]|uniref:amidase domain-containing protein n=2 Tax=unclassified Tissierella TaxID=2638726 RepID=UPI00303B0B66
MKKIKISLILCFILLISTAAYAYTPFENRDNLDNIYQELREQIIEDYSAIYALDNFSYDYSVREEGSIKYIDMNIHTDMTLTRPPSDSPFIQGLNDAFVNETIEDNKIAIQKEIDFYTENIEMYYNKPYASTFTYTIAINETQDVGLDAGLTKVNNNYELFYRNDTSEEIILIRVDDLAEVENESLARQSGYNAAQTIVNRVQAETNSIQPFASFTYDRLAARDWANNNATSASEFPSANVSGTDCANFVSKALNAGGIPEDKSGKWYRASTWGGWPGDNWFRTGYYNNGGVVPYMTGKGYFYKETNDSKVFAGSIMNWTATSHVALVTYGDTVKIMYAQHGAVNNKNNVYRDANGVYVSNVNFYMPSTSIMN